MLKHLITCLTILGCFAIAFCTLENMVEVCNFADIQRALIQRADYVSEPVPRWVIDARKRERELEQKIKQQTEKLKNQGDTSWED